MGIDINTLLNIIIPIIVSSIVSIIGIYSNQAINKAQAKKIDKEADAVETESKVETTEKLIQAAGRLVEQYSSALERFKQEEIDYITVINNNKAKLDILSDKVDEQEHTIEFLLKTNQELASIGIEMFRGVEILIKQLEEENIKPKWQPTKDIYDKLSILEEFNLNGYRKN